MSRNGLPVGGRRDVDDSDRLVAMRTEPARAEPPAKRLAIFTTLFAQIAGLALRALIHDQVLGQPPREPERGFVGARPTKPEATLAAGVGAPDPAWVSQEAQAAGRTGVFERSRRVTQRGLPPAPARAATDP